MKQGSHPVRDGVNLAVAPKGNCQQWRRNYSLFSIITRRIPPLMDSQCRLGWRAPKPMKTCISSRRFCTILWSISNRCRIASWRRRRIEKRLCKGWIASSLMPPNGPLIVQQMMPHNVSIRVGKKTAYAEEYGHVAPEQAYRLSGAYVERSPSRLHHVETRVSA